MFAISVAVYHCDEKALNALVIKLVASFTEPNQAVASLADWSNTLIASSALIPADLTSYSASVSSSIDLGDFFAISNTASHISSILSTLVSTSVATLDIADSKFFEASPAS